MSITEFIGFLITIVAMFGIIISRALEARKRRRDPEAYEREIEEKEEKLREFLKTLNVDFPEKKKAPPPPPKGKKIVPPQPVQEKSLEEAPTDEAYEIKKARPSRLKNMVKDPRQLIIFKEIMTPYDPFR